MPSRKMEAQLEALSQLRHAAKSEEAVSLLRKSLADPVGLVAAKAATVVGEMQLRELTPDLLKAFARFFEHGAKRDPQCWAKIALAKALKDLDYSICEPFVRGLSCQQWEPVWGSEADTAGPLRAVSFLAIVQCTDLLRDEKMMHLVHGLTDAEATVRIDVTRALEQMEGREAVLLLRLKARLGDREAAVTGQALQSLLAVEGQRAIAFVSEFLWQRGQAAIDVEVSELAALALGASRLAAGLDVLMKCWKERTSLRVDQTVVLRALSASRQELALEFLLEVVRNGRQQEAVNAVEALALHRYSENLRAGVQAAVEERDNAELRSAFQQAFG